MITTSAIRKPARVVERSTVDVHVTGHATWDQAVDAGLEALGFTREGLFGYGIEGNPSHVDNDTTVTVYADRD